MIEHNDLRNLYIVMSALAGSFTALYSMKYKQMTWSEILFTLLVGFAFAVIAVPYIAADWMKIDITNLRAICFAVYAGGTAWNVMIPVIIKRFKSSIGLEEKA